MHLEQYQAYLMLPLSLTSSSSLLLTHTNCNLPWIVSEMLVAKKILDSIRNDNWSLDSPWALVIFYLQLLEAFATCMLYVNNVYNIVKSWLKQDCEAD